MANWSRLPSVALVAVALMLLLSGCAGGKYIFDVFPELHYAPSYRAQEPPVRDVPPGSVPVSQTVTLPNPLTFSPPQPESAERLYQINCVPCHGQGGKGDGLVAPYFRAAGTIPPADLTSSVIQERSDASLYDTLTVGKYDPQSMVGMPPFGSLLTPDERRALVEYVRQLGGQ